MTYEQAAKQIVFVLLRKASKADAEILIRRFLLGESLKSLAASYNVTHQAVSVKVDYACRRTARQIFYLEGKEHLIARSKLLKKTIKCFGKVWLNSRIEEKQKEI